MRLAFVLLAGLALASCDRLPWAGAEAPVEAAPPVASERVEAFAFAVERTGCTVDPVSHDALHQAGFSDAELASIGDILVADGRARLTDGGELILQTEDCL
jgi:hypothetical protein